MSGENGWSYSYGTNPYSNPAAVGLEIVDELDFSSGSYEFSLLVVWRQLETGHLFYSEDSGCSCPIPFEDVRGVADLTKITSVKALQDHINGRLDQNGYERMYVGPSDVQRFLAKVRDAKKATA